MKIESKETRSLFVRSFYGLVPDLIIALVVAIYVDDGVLSFFFVLIGLQILYLLLWIKTASWNWAVFHFFDRKKMSRKILDYLDQNNYPRPDEFLRDVSSYFEGIIESEDNKPELRIKAAAEYGARASNPSDVTSKQFVLNREGISSLYVCS